MTNFDDRINKCYELVMDRTLFSDELNGVIADFWLI